MSVGAISAMALSSGDVYLLNGEAFRFLLTLKVADRDALDHAFQALADNPFTAGDYQECNEDGQTTEVLLRGRFVVTFRADHAAKEVRILRVERV